MAPETAAGLTVGQVTLLNTRQRPAPRDLATSSVAASDLISAAETARYTYGAVPMVSTNQAAKNPLKPPNKAVNE